MMMSLTTLKAAMDDVRKLSELFIAGLMTPAIARTAAELIEAGESLSYAILALGWIILFARLGVIVLELWERYAGPPPAPSE